MIERSYHISFVDMELLWIVFFFHPDHSFRNLWETMITDPKILILNITKETEEEWNKKRSKKWKKRLILNRKSGSMCVWKRLLHEHSQKEMILMSWLWGIATLVCQCMWWLICLLHTHTLTAKTPPCSCYSACLSSLEEPSAFRAGIALYAKQPLCVCVYVCARRHMCELMYFQKYRVPELWHAPGWASEINIWTQNVRIYRVSIAWKKEKGQSVEKKKNQISLKSNNWLH